MRSEYKTNQLEFSIHKSFHIHEHFEIGNEKSKGTKIKEMRDSYRPIHFPSQEFMEISLIYMYSLSLLIAYSSQYPSSAVYI